MPRAKLIALVEYHRQLGDIRRQPPRQFQGSAVNFFMAHAPRAGLGHPLGVRQPRPGLLRDGLAGRACVPGLYLGGHSRANRQVLAQEHQAGERLQHLLRLWRSAAAMVEGSRGTGEPQSACSARLSNYRAYIIFGHDPAFKGVDWADGPGYEYQLIQY